jgi:hypothetical protein
MTPAIEVTLIVLGCWFALSIAIGLVLLVAGARRASARPSDPPSD